MIQRHARRIGWRPRSTPLPPKAILARGPVVEKLIAKVLDRFATLGEPEGVAGDGFVVLIGDEARLPWVDGVRYFGRDRAAPFLYLPTTLEPDVPVHLLGLALGPTLSLVDPESETLIPLEEALPLSADKLRARIAR